LIAPHSLLKLKASYSVQEGELNAEIKLKKKFPSLHNLFPPFFFRKKAGKKRGGKKFFEKETFYPLSLHNYYPEKKGGFFLFPSEFTSLFFTSKKGRYCFLFLILAHHP
jgi:hypothetical protein